jgi:pimeloyl-ACP methyl ester carboxylesterase
LRERKIQKPEKQGISPTDAASGVTPARAAAIATQAKSALLADATNFPFPEINRVWQMPDLGDKFRAPVTTSVPTLFVAGTLDGTTPVAQTREIVKTFSAARLLTVENGGHNSQLRPAEVQAAIAGFFAGKTPPERVTMPVPAFMPLLATQN